MRYGVTYEQAWIAKAIVGERGRGRVRVGRVTPLKSELRRVAVIAHIGHQLDGPRGLATICGHAENDRVEQHSWPRVEDDRVTGRAWFDVDAEVGGDSDSSLCPGIRDGDLK